MSNPNEERIKRLEDFVVEELARIWNCWPSPGRESRTFNFEQFELWKNNFRNDLLKGDQL